GATVPHGGRCDLSRQRTALQPQRSSSPRLTNGTFIPYSLNGTSTPIVRQLSDQSEILSPVAPHALGELFAHHDRRSPLVTTTLERQDLEPETTPDLDPKRFRALGVIAVAQLMVVLDASVVIIALPSAQRSLHISTANRQWMLTAYTLAFAGLLLLGGRIADYLGRKRMFLISLIGFAAASALGGLAQNSAMLFSARALQGAFAAIMAPSALSLLTVAFSEPKERARAFGVYGGIAGGGAAIGLILGGALTQYASWRWTLLINVPIAIVAALAAARFVTESKSPVRHGYGIPGAVTATGGLLALVYAFTKAGLDVWASSTTLMLFAIA